jgi:hypothetical protein
MINEATLVGDNHPGFGLPSNRLCGNPASADDAAVRDGPAFRRLQSRKIQQLRGSYPAASQLK